MSLLPPPPSNAWPNMPPVWWRWFQSLFVRVGGSPSGTLAPLTSPTFTGTPAVPTAAPGTSTTQAASTEFVMIHADPPGAVAAFAGASAPSGWLLCDGAAVSRTTHAALFAAIGTTYGPGDGSTTFNVPDGRGRSLIGAGQGAGLTNRALAATGGVETVTLTSAQSGSPAHGHGVTDPGHNHTSNIWHDVFGTTGATDTLGTAAGTAGGHNSAVRGAYTGLTVNNSVDADASASHENMPPFLAVNWIIKT